MADQIRIAGIDEAGRGSIIGPLVVAGVLIRPEDENQLRKIGVRDSKELTPLKREKLAKQIEAIAQETMLVKVSPCKIDTARRTGTNLNRLEELKFADILAYLDPHTAHIDCPDVNTKRFTASLRNLLPNKAVQLVVEHKADSTYPSVGAASILAKVERDRDIEEIKQKYGDVGPGYTSNETTMQWLRNWKSQNKEWPDIVRKTWVTADVVAGEQEQKKLGDWLKAKLGKPKPC